MHFRIAMLFVFMAFLNSAAYTQQPIKLIVRADDMGYHNDINYAIIKAHKEGIVTSASIMPASLFFDEGVKLCKENPKLAAGVHVADIVRKICLEQNVVYGQNVLGSQNGYTWVYNDFESWPLQRLPDGAIAYYDIVPMPDEKKQMFYDLLENLKPGTLILAVHPGLVGKERSDVTLLMCSQKARDIIKRKNIQLISYSDISK